MKIDIEPMELVALFKALNDQYSGHSTPQLPSAPAPIALLLESSTTPSYSHSYIQSYTQPYTQPTIHPSDAYMALAEVMGYEYQMPGNPALMPTTVETTAIVPVAPAPAQSALDRIKQVTAGLQRRPIDLGNAEIEGDDEPEDRHGFAKLVFKVLIGGAIGLLAATALLGLSGRTAPGFANLLLMRIPIISSEEAKPAASPSPAASEAPAVETEKPKGDEPVTVPAPPPPPVGHQPPSGTPAYPLPAVEVK